MSIWPTQPIWNAANVTLDKQPGSMPNVADTLSNYLQLLTVERVTKTVINFNVVETTAPQSFQGVIAPFPSQELKMKPINQRAWSWKKIFAYPSITLIPDDVVKDQQGVQYRVMKRDDFTQYGYISYDCVQDYSGSGPTTE